MESISNDDILKWFYEKDAESQNDLMNDADSDPADEKFYKYMRKHYGKYIKKFIANY